MKQNLVFIFLGAIITAAFILLVLHPQSITACVAFVSAIVVSTAAFHLDSKKDKSQAAVESILEIRLLALEAKNTELKDRIENLATAQGLR